MPSKRSLDQTEFEGIEEHVASFKRARRHSILDYVDEVTPHHLHVHTDTPKEFHDALTEEFPPLGEATTPIKTVKITKKKSETSKPKAISGNWTTAIKKHVLARVNGRARSPIVGLEIQYQEIYSLLEHTIVEGEGNSCLLMGPRSCGKTLIVDTALDRLQNKYKDQFITIRLSGFSQSDDKMALREITRQFDVELKKKQQPDDDEHEGLEKKSMSETLQALLDLLDPQQQDLDGVDENGEPTMAPPPAPVAVVIILEEFDRFTQVSRQTLLYNLFDLAQSSTTPLAVIGVTARMNTRELFEKRVRSRFSQRVYAVSRSKTLDEFWAICRAALHVSLADLETIQVKHSASSSIEEELSTAVETWNAKFDQLYNQKDSAFFRLLETIFYTTKDVREFYDKILFALNKSGPDPCIADHNISKFQPEQEISDTQHFILGLSELELSLLISAARVEVKFESETFNFNVVYDEYVDIASLLNKERMAAMSSVDAGPGAGYRVWSRDVARSAWERLESMDLVLYVDASFGCMGNTHGAGGLGTGVSSVTGGAAASGGMSGGGATGKGTSAVRDDLRMAKVDANLLEIADIIGHDHVLRRWTRL